MLGRGLIALLATVFTGVSAFCGSALAQHHHHHHGTDYPIVISPTGQPYGPTQAHYQYFKKYGHAYNGYTGLDIVNGYPGGNLGYFGGNVPVAPYGAYGLGYYHFGYGGFGGYYGGPYSGYYPGFAPIWGPVPINVYPTYTTPGFSGTSYYYGYPAGAVFPPAALPSNFFSPAMQDAVREERERWEKPLIKIDPPAAQQIVEPSTPEAKLRSVREEGEGDRAFRKMNYAAATASYRDAIKVARDRAEPRFKLGLALAARGQFVEAVRELKLALAMDPTWPQHPDRLDDLVGDENVLPQEVIKSQIADWTKEDIRDPDRLFLLGVILRMEGDDRDEILFETAARLDGMQPHLAAFLSSEPAAKNPVAAKEPSPPKAEEPAPVEDDDRNHASPEEFPKPVIPSNPPLLPPLPE